MHLTDEKSIRRRRILLSQLRKDVLKRVLILKHNLTRLAALCGSHDTGLFELVHKTAGPVIADGETALYHRRAALLGNYYSVGSLFEQRVERTGIYSSS